MGPTEEMENNPTNSLSSSTDARVASEEPHVGIDVVFDSAAPPGDNDGSIEPPTNTGVSLEMPGNDDRSIERNAGLGQNTELFVSTQNSEMEPAVGGLRRSTRTTAPPAWMKDYVGFQVYVEEYSMEEEPRNFAEASPHSTWQQAMREELQALEENKTWELAHLALGKKAIVKGEDYEEIFAPVAKATTMRIALALAKIYFF
ncbi:hypothetical protein M569_11483 [Genlisea aurea]|uniref:Reverse transcriptase Ty1/copia-type domain-containing protein n=1 Tax=Genlisea aurea TaxID=192259 RepID=S8DTZ8_9LAMI|nr:hypothetical protein M569_11483 [Genlisea aurea]